MRATLEARDEVNLRRLITWRVEVLMDGFWADGGEALWCLAEDLAIDYRDAIQLREAGCPVELALEILT